MIQQRIYTKDNDTTTSFRSGNKKAELIFYLFVFIEPVSGGGRFWTGQAGDGGEDSEQDIVTGAACEEAAVGAAQAEQEEALHCGREPILDGPRDDPW